MAAKQSQKSGGGNRKKGRNRDWCNGYEAANCRARNKLLRMARTLNRQPNNQELRSRFNVWAAENPNAAKAARQVLDE